LRGGKTQDDVEKQREGIRVGDIVFLAEEIPVVAP
jgi:hypothetical protein